MQSEIEKAVHQDGKAAGQRSSCHAASEFVVRLTPGKAFAKQNHEETQSQQAGYDAAVSKGLQIIIVSLFETIHSVARIVARVNQAERT